MCPEQQMALVTLLDIRKASNENLKALYLPSKSAREKWASADAMQQSHLRNNMSSSGLAIAELLFPAVSAVINAKVRSDSFFNRVLTVEAIRMHVATHNGRPPASLKDLSPVDAFPDSLSDSNFQYKVEDRDRNWVVTLSAEVPGHLNRYRDQKVTFPKP